MGELKYLLLASGQEWDKHTLRMTGSVLASLIIPTWFCSIQFQRLFWKYATVGNALMEISKKRGGTTVVLKNQEAASRNCQLLVCKNSLYYGHSALGYTLKLAVCILIKQNLEFTLICTNKSTFAQIIIFVVITFFTFMTDWINVDVRNTKRFTLPADSGPHLKHMKA